MTENNDNESAKTRINISRGGLRRVSNAEGHINIINPENPFPVKGERLRYSLSNKLLGRLEGLTKIEFKHLGPFVEKHKIGIDSIEAILNIAQSVQASSKIEGEEISVKRLELYLNAVTREETPFKGKRLDRGEKAFKSINETYKWALKRDSRTIISVDFILETHRRMFKSSLPDIAGVLKNKKVIIEWEDGAGYKVETLSHTKVKEVLNALCERTNNRLAAAESQAEYSTFLTIAEFIIDFLAIHPFTDGNGRTARLLSTYLIERCGFHFARFYALDNIIFETRKEYYQALYAAQKNWYQEKEDLSLWIDYYIKAIFSQARRALQRARDQYGIEHKAK